MTVEVNLATDDERTIIKNLFLFYRYDLMPFAAGFVGASLNHFAAIGVEGTASHDASLADLDIWWTKPGILLPMLIRVDGHPAGLAMVSRPPHAHRSVDFRMEDFFVVNQWRRGGVGQSAAAQVFARQPGLWEIGWMSGNATAEQFWRRIVPMLAESIEEWNVEQSPGQSALPGLRAAVRPGRGPEDIT